MPHPFARSSGLALALTLLLTGSAHAAVSKPAGLGTTLKVPPNLLKLSDLISGAYKNASPAQKLGLASQLTTRFRLLAPVSIGTKTGTGLNGLRYSIGKSAPLLPAASAGTPSVANADDNLIVCRTIPIVTPKQFAGPLFIGGGSPNHNVLFPGALFKDSDVVNGRFVPQTLSRLPGTIDIDVFNAGGGVSTPVSNFNDRSVVMGAINTLRTQTASASALTQLDYSQLEVAAGQQVSLEVEASADVDLGPLLRLPITPGGTAGVTGSTAVTTTNSQNFAIGMIDQVFYTISVGGEGPASTVSGTIPGDVVCITDVQYGRVAYIVVAAIRSRTEAEAVASELVQLSLPLAQASQGATVSAEAQLAFASNAVTLKIVGGDLANAVTVRDLATLRNYVERIQPTVGGVNAVPIRYTLRYAADNATAFVGAVATFSDRECARAQRIRVKLESIKPTKVVDFGNEELFGKVGVLADANVTIAGGALLWNQSVTAPIQGVENVAIPIGSEITLHLNELAGPPSTNVHMDFQVRDRVMDDPEGIAAGTTSTCSAGGVQYRCVKYSCAAPDVRLSDIANASGSRLTRSFGLREGAEASLNASVTFELLPLQ